jgi:hypothetical protein
MMCFFRVLPSGYFPFSLQVLSPVFGSILIFSGFLVSIHLPFVIVPFFMVIVVPAKVYHAIQLPPSFTIVLFSFTQYLSSQSTRNQHDAPSQIELPRVPILLYPSGQFAGFALHVHLLHKSRDEVT